VSGGGACSVFLGLRDERCEGRADGVAPADGLVLRVTVSLGKSCRPGASLISFLCRDDFRLDEAAATRAFGWLLSDDSSWGPEDGLPKSAMSSRPFNSPRLPYPAFDILAAALLRVRVFGGDAVRGVAAAARASCSSTLVRFLRDRLFESGLPPAAASRSGLGSRAAAAFLFRELVVVVVAVVVVVVVVAVLRVAANVGGCDGVGCCEVEFWCAAESLAAERVTLDDMRTGSYLIGSNCVHWG
jgi:hypothetical protein